MLTCSFFFSFVIYFSFLYLDFWALFHCPPTLSQTCCLYLIQQHPKTSLQDITCISTSSSFHPLSLSRFLFLFLFHLWPPKLLRFRAFFHQPWYHQWPIACIWYSNSPSHHLYLMQQLLHRPTITCIWYSNLPSSQLASLQNALCLQLCQFMFSLSLALFSVG